MAGRSRVEKALEELLRLVRRSSATPSNPWARMSRKIPDDLQSDEPWLFLFDEEVGAFENVCAELADDRRFEHLNPGAAEAATWRFVCRAHLGQKNLVAAFLSEHADDLMQRTCFFPVEGLTVKEEVELYGVRLLPTDAVTVPAQAVMMRDPRPTMGSVIATTCEGTNHQKMAARALPAAQHALRLLRATLREDQFVVDRQLLFRLGETVWFDDDIAMWALRADKGWPLELTKDLIDLATSKEIASLPPVGRNDVERRALRALQWFERAQLETEAITATLYLFYALETILGDRSKGEKASLLAVRRATLDMVTGDGGFSHPRHTYSLYDEVRSDAVHGEEPRIEITDRDVVLFSWDVRGALNQFLQYARANKFTRRKQVTDALDAEQQRGELVAWLLEQDTSLSKQLKKDQRATGG